MPSFASRKLNKEQVKYMLLNKLGYVIKVFEDGNSQCHIATDWAAKDIVESDSGDALSLSSMIAGEFNTTASEAKADILAQLSTAEKALTQYRKSREPKHSEIVEMQSQINVLAKKLERIEQFEETESAVDKVLSMGAKSVASVKTTFNPNAEVEKQAAELAKA